MDPSSIENFGRAFLALGPPVLLGIGTLATTLGAIVARGGSRWLILLLGPPVTLATSVGATWFVLAVLRPAEGSGFLLGGAAIALFVMALAPYYVVLGVVRLRVERGQAGRGDVG